MSAILMTTAGWLVLAITPVERLRAAQRLKGGEDNSYLILLAAIVVTLIVTFLLIAYRRRSDKKAKETGGKDFFELANRRGLSKREVQILFYIAKLAGLTHPEAIFTMEQAFNKGAMVLAEQAPSEGANTEYIRQLGLELKSLREKLGFQIHSKGGSGSSGAGHKLSSLEIPEGKTLHLSRRLDRDADDIEATVASNSETGLTIRLPFSLHSPVGQLWRVRYYFGASVWEFDAKTIGNDGDILILEHTQEVRFINRRRFLRVPVRRKAFVAVFPFEKQLLSQRDEEQTFAGEVFSSRSVLPDFVEAVLVELAGPGLRIELSQELYVGQRVIVIFDLESTKAHHLHQQKRSGRATVRAIEDIGTIRHVKPVDNGYSVAVELTGLGDTDVNELIRATNVAAAEANSGDDSEESVSTEAVPADVSSTEGV